MNPKSNSIVYSPILSCEEQGTSSDEDRSLLKEQPTNWLETNTRSSKTRHRLLRRPFCLLITANILLFTTSILTLILSANLYHLAGYPLPLIPPPLNALLKATSQPSPLLSKLNIPLTTKRMNGTLLNDPTNPQTIYRMPPSPEVDAAWERIQTRNPIAITRSDVLKLNKDPLNLAKYPPSFHKPFLSNYPEFTTPDETPSQEAYIAKLDIFHQIHCLNTLRMNLHTNYPYYHPASSSSLPENAASFIEPHVSHCLGILLENLMCAGNVDIYTHYWTDVQQQPFPDFNIDHKCRDFDAILAWQEEFSVPVEEFAKVVEPPGDARVFRVGEEMRRVLGGGHHHVGGEHV